MRRSMKSKEFWIKELNSWAYPLKDILKDSYMDKLMNFLSVEYVMNDIIPNKNEVFQYFRNCDYKNVRIVILVPSSSSLTNIGKVIYNEEIRDFGQGPLRLVHQCVERQYELNLGWDYSLKHWGKQGILILPLSLTTRKSGESHQRQWNKFINFVLKQIDEYKPGTIFLQWGTDLSISNKHWNLKYESPEQALIEYRDWNFDFKKVNKKLKELNNIEIIW